MSSSRFRQLQEVFHAALGHAPEAREAFVREIRENDEALGRELMSLLEAHREGDRFLESGLIEDDVPLLAGQTVGPYRVVNEIGRGGMGVVYLAEDTRLGRRVALKALSPALVSDPRQQERFRREAMVAGSLSHPAIATIYALEEVDGRFFIVSEYVPGEPLRIESERAPLPIGRVLDIGLQLADALAAAHEKGVVHRDLKPENILCLDDRRLKIVDFGLALVGGSAPTHPRLTGTGMLVGTPSYMSPEQLCGETVDFRSDLFCLGILLYELLLGQHPFESGTVIGTSARILESDPGGLARLRVSASGLDRVIARCLEKVPDDRFGSAREVVAELQRLKQESSSAPENAFASGSTPAHGPEKEAAESELRSHWWIVHQVSVVALYMLMIILCFVLNAMYSAPLLIWSAFVALACGIWNGAMRVHLLFTLRFNRGALRKELDRAARLMWPIDLAFSLVLVGVGMNVLPESQPWAAVMAAVGICYGVVFFIVEPTTARSVFPE
jgi:serine/threonine protein kinase